MWEDPIVAETRQLREQYANQFDSDSNAIFDDILRRQSNSEKELVSFQARKPASTVNYSQQQNAADFQPAELRPAN